jgi:PAS domain S-box-containing protein
VPPNGLVDLAGGEPEPMTPRPLLVLLAVAVAVCVFAIDYFSRLDGAIAVLHVAVILLVAPLGRRSVIIAGLGTSLLAAAAFIGDHLYQPSEGALSRLLVSLVAIAITTLLSLRDRSTRTTLGEQARILELSHDTVIIRDRDEAILYWNDGAERLYGWSRQEALGERCNTLLLSSFPVEEVAIALERDGQWSGEVTRTRRDGERLTLASRWLLRRDPEGRPVGVIESSADVTEQRRADAERHASEESYRTIFEAAGFAIWESDWSGAMATATEGAPSGKPLEAWLAARPERVQNAIDNAVIRNANEAAVDIFGGATKADLIGKNLCDRCLPESTPEFAHIIAELAGGAGTAETETRLRTLDGRIVDIVLRVTVLPDSTDWSNMLVMAVDVTERNEARARLEQTSAELAHAARVSILGQLAASIAHEVNQPLTAIINYGKSARRWLARPEPDLAELSECLEKIISNGTRAGDVIGRVRSLARKTAPQTGPLDLDDLIDDAIALIQHEARAQDVVIRRSGKAASAVVGDRIQIQQVLVNLLMNGIQAMRDTATDKRELCIIIDVSGAEHARVAVQDCGTGFSDGSATRLFEPFFTTKKEGMGMGLSICRSIIEGQGGRIEASNNAGAGATVSFTLPAQKAGLAVEHEAIS